ncbi:APC family permease [Pseudogracilibacillus auburnensis]|uniref:Amino acid/polyamine/organocation transporter (APC superfamily) n=1 Tax=Pseudogracilibacillus auburnensis TaxID=1494959 RepID=A0A2V3WN31_9BACI|nr:APC family permease [Pseudogracilibacillus auburnensis]PXW90109.1 amino acid/polyamine/organocation transporter (APC superfamily) [Pseudogracilibacillus auburnensis]
MEQPSKKISLIGAIAIIVGTVVGASIFILLGPIAGQTGPSLFLAYLVAFLPALFGSIFYAQLGSAMPATGGTYHYSKRLLNPTIGYIATISLILGGIGATVMLAIGFAEYLHFFIPTLPVKFAALIIILILYGINLLGLKSAEMAQILMTIWILLALFIFAIPGLFHIEPQNLTPLIPNGLGSFLMGSALAVYSYVGYGIISEIGGNIENPKRNIPKATFISLGIIVCIYALVAFVAIGVVPWEQLSTSGASVAEAARIFLHPQLVFFISIGALFATVTTINAVFMTIPGDFKALAKEGIFNKKVMRKEMNNTPFFPITILVITSCIGIYTGFSVDFFATITIVGLLLNTVILGIALWKLPQKEKEAYENAPYRIKKGILRFAIVLGVLLNTIFILLAVLDYPIVILLYIVWIVVGYLMHRRKIPKLVKNRLNTAIND